MDRIQNKPIKLYNVMFPVWMLLLFPQMWLVALPVNFAVDSLVLLLAMKLLHYDSAVAVWKKSILWVWLYGFLADIIGAALLTGVLLLASYLDWPIALSYYGWGDALIALPAVVLAGVLIYFLDKKFALRKTGLTNTQKHKIALALAVFTAPYTFMIPLNWIYF